MKLYDKGRLNLTDRVSDYLPWLQDTDKKDITVRQLLLHESGLPSTLLFYLEAIDKESYEGTLFKAKPDAAHSAQIGVRTWANPKFKFQKGLTSKVRTAEHTLQVSDSIVVESLLQGGISAKDYRNSVAATGAIGIVVSALSCCSSWWKRVRECRWMLFWSRSSMLRWD